MQIKAEAIVVAPSGALRFLTLVNPDGATCKLLASVDPWTAVTDLTLIDQDRFERESKHVYPHAWILDVVAADTTANVLLVRIMDRQPLSEAYGVPA